MGAVLWHCKVYTNISMNIHSCGFWLHWEGIAFIFAPEHSPSQRILISNGENWKFKSKAEPDFILKFKWKKTCNKACKNLVTYFLIAFLITWLFWAFFDFILNGETTKSVLVHFCSAWYEIMLLSKLLLLSLGKRLPIKSTSKMWGART